MSTLPRSTGRRKESIARVQLVPGTGKRTVNGKTFAEYFPTPTLLMLIDQPLVLVEQADKWDVIATAKSGGLSGQAGAIRLGIARQLDKIDRETFHSPLRKTGCLTRDSRAVERKKYGRRGARARFQFSKR
ncbi:MAG TPA: 30S ribosomal protein S9 [Fibrobacteria bacterium]|nr:30S ribosomal protein S9 [Fibrobacteria bacterium]